MSRAADDGEKVVTFPGGTPMDAPAQVIKAKDRKKDKAVQDAKASLKGGKGGGGREPPAPPPMYGPPKRLPSRDEGCPVEALGTFEGLYYYTDALGQVRKLKEPDHGRTQIFGLFGGEEYLAETWPKWRWASDGTPGGGRWEKSGEFDHAKLAPVMISSCHARGLFDPANKVRGCGCWAEDDGNLVMHCGRWLFRTEGKAVLGHVDPGLRDGRLYARKPALPEPNFLDAHEAGPRVLAILETWNWRRPAIDPKFVLGWIICALLGQAGRWRPHLWVTGGKGTGKSTLRNLMEWLLSEAGIVAPVNTSPAFIYQTLGDSCVPLVLDEFESKDDDNRRVQDVIELMRIMSTGGELGRGGSENNPRKYTLRSAAIAFSILRPAMAGQDISRMAFCELNKLRRAPGEDAPELDLMAPVDDDMVLGSKTKWAATGAHLRGLVLQQWHRYPQTFNAYFRALLAAGHEHRAASQFGALGAGYDLAMHALLRKDNVEAWVAMLPAGDLDETKGIETEPTGCLQHLLAHVPDQGPISHGTRETVAFYLRQARKDMEDDRRVNDPSDAGRVLARLGIRVYRDLQLITQDAAGHDVPVVWVAVASTHPALADVFRGTHWKGRAGAKGTWAQALSGLDGAAEKAIQMRIDDGKWWVTRLMYDAVLPPFSDAEDEAEIATVDPRDRRQTDRERKGEQ